MRFLRSFTGVYVIHRRKEKSIDASHKEPLSNSSLHEIQKVSHLPQPPHRLYLMTDDLDQCQYTCMTLLRNDKDNEEATVMMADLAFRKNDYESAMFHFQQLLQKRPDYWVALARLVEVGEKRKWSKAVYFLRGL